MKKTLVLLAASLFFITLFNGSSVAQSEKSDIFKDELLDNLVGDWKLTRKIQGETAENTVKAEWVLNHQFLRIDMKGVKKPAEYEATIYIGYDKVSERYVAHWIDVFGARFSEALGYGQKVNADSIRFIFEYPDGPFHNTFTWNSKTKTWQFLMQQKDRSGKWVVFAEDNLRR